MKYRQESPFGFVKTKPLGDFLGAPVVKNPPATAGDTGSIPTLRRPLMPWGN